MRRYKVFVATFLALIFLIEIVAPASNVSAADASKSQISPSLFNHDVSGQGDAGISSLGLMSTGTVKVSISFAAKNYAQLSNYLDCSKTQKNGRRHVLSEKQFEADYSPAQSSYDRVVAYLLSQKLKVTQTWANRLLINAEGSVSDVERAFGTKIGLFSYENSTFYRSVDAIKIPQVLSGCCVAGINVDSCPATPFLQVANAEVTPDSSSSPLTFGSPADFKALYGTNQAIQNGYTGAGSTIAVVDSVGDSSIVTDLNNFDSYFGLPAANLTINGNNTGTTGNWAMETALDVEWAHAMAPGAAIILQISDDVFAAVNSLVTSSSPPNVISLSWGETESSNPPQYSSIFAAAAAKGITVYASTGDLGARNGNTRSGPGSNFSVNYPASDPNIVAVGGTEVYYDTVQGAKQYYEYGWSGSGGGYSTLFQEPSYQTNAGIPDQSRQRAIPDVSLDASSASCVNIFYNNNSVPTGVYGTSVASPMMAGISAIALTEGYKLDNNALYSIYNSSKYGVAFHDIYLSGNNGYAVKSGWDEVTGLGSINFQNFAAIYSQSSGLSLTGQSLAPSSVDLSQSFTLSYTISNPNSANSLGQIGLGASIRLHGTNTTISDASNDIYLLNVQGGLSTQTRQFATNTSFISGSYDVKWQVWMGQPGLGNLLASSGWQTNQLQIDTPLDVSVTPATWIMDVGQSKTFTANPTGGSGIYPSYQWYVNGTSQNGATSSTLNYLATTAGSSAITVTVTDNSGSVSSQSAASSVTVNPAPTVTVSPSSWTMDVGQSKQFTASASGGSVTLSYQWYLAGSPLSGQTGVSYTVTASSAVSPQVYCAVTDRASSPVTVQSNTPIITVNTPLTAPAVSSSANTIDQGQSLSLSISSPNSGSSPYSFQWLQKPPATESYSSIASANSSLYTFLTTTGTTPGTWNFILRLTDGTGAAVNSSAFSVVVNPALAPTISVSLGAVDQGQTATLTATVSSTGTPQYVYQWSIESPSSQSLSPIANANVATYAFVTSSSTQTGQWLFEVQVTDQTGAAVTSAVSTVTVDYALAAPTLTHTASVVTQGQTSSLSISAVTTGTSPYAYQWFSEAPGAASYSSIVGATFSSYDFATSTSTTTGTWSFILQMSDSAGSAVNSTATAVTVNAPASNPSPTPTATNAPTATPTAAPTATPSPTSTLSPVIVSSATSSVTVSDNSASVDQRATTGVNVNVSGSTLQNGSQLNVTSIYYGDDPPSETGKLSVSGAAFYDLSVTASGDSLGSQVTVTVSITNPCFTSTSVIEYWNGNNWVSVASTFTAPDTVSGKIPASALTGTPILVGLPQSNPAGPGLNSVALFTAISTVAVVLIVLGVVFVYLKKRSRRNDAF